MNLGVKYVASLCTCLTHVNVTLISLRGGGGGGGGTDISRSSGFAMSVPL